MARCLFAAAVVAVALVAPAAVQADAAQDRAHLQANVAYFNTLQASPAHQAALQKSAKRRSRELAGCARRGTGWRAINRIRDKRLRRVVATNARILWREVRYYSDPAVGAALPADRLMAKKFFGAVEPAMTTPQMQALVASKRVAVSAAYNTYALGCNYFNQAVRSAHPERVRRASHVIKVANRMSGAANRTVERRRKKLHLDEHRLALASNLYYVAGGDATLLSMCPLFDRSGIGSCSGL